MAIPLKCLITVEMGKATDVGQAILQSDLELDAPKHVFLMLFMLIDRKKPDRCPPLTLSHCLAPSLPPLLWISAHHAYVSRRVVMYLSACSVPRPRPRLSHLHSRGSFFKPYYDILPATLSNMPIFWNDEELAELEGSYLLTQIDERNRAIEHDYNAICHLCPHFADVATLFDFKVFVPAPPLSLLRCIHGL